MNLPIRKKPKLFVELEDVRSSVGQGLQSAELSLFEYCTIARNRILQLNKVVRVLEDSLTSEEALEELKGKSMSVRFDYYNAFTKIIMNLSDYLEKVYSLASDQAKFDIIRNKIDKLTNASPVLKDGCASVVGQGAEVVDDLLKILQEEMVVRNKNNI